MYPSDVTDPAAVIKAIRECDRLGEEVFRRRYGRGPRTKFALLHEGRLYDPKAILAAAHFHQLGGSIGRFAGGPQTNSRLARLGFTVIQETGDGTPAEAPRRRNQSRAFAGVPYRRQRLDAGVTARTPFFVDPDVIDRGNRGHKETQNALAAAVRNLRLRPRSPAAGEPLYDLAWKSGTSVFVAEVKSVTSSNEERQLRLGLGQVLRYQQLLRAATARVTPVLAVERRPSDGSWLKLCDALGVRLVWPDVFTADRLTP